MNGLGRSSTLWPVTCGRRAAARGFSLLGVLLLIALLTTFMGVAAMGLHSGTLALDLHEDLARAQAAADGALEEALARLSAGQTPSFHRAEGSGVQVEVKADSGALIQNQEGMVEFQVCGSVRRSAPATVADAAGARVNVRLRSRAFRSGPSAWRLLEYETVEASCL